MRRIMTARIGGHYMVVPKLIGLLLVLVALFYFLAATIDVVTSWDKMQDVKSCLQVVHEKALADADYQPEMDTLICSTKALAAGVYPYSDGVDYMDMWKVLSEKSGWWIFWVLVLVIALVIYQSGKLFEVEEDVLETAEVKEEKKTVKKAKKTEATKPKRTTRRRKTTK
jgi:phosphotransferase system  glucose/maltose/N-acetylglucosamine-specific IIC component